MLDVVAIFPGTGVRCVVATRRFNAAEQVRRINETSKHCRWDMGKTTPGKAVVQDKDRPQALSQSRLDAPEVAIIGPMRIWPDKTDRFPNMAVQDMCQ